VHGGQRTLQTPLAINRLTTADMHKKKAFFLESPKDTHIAAASQLKRSTLSAHGEHTLQTPLLMN
jgi:hypothetical protein